MNYRETLDYLYTTLPMFQRIGAAAYKGDLNNTIALCASLDNPQDKFRSIHVAGTNGKGSSSHMLAAILQCAGYKTGLYTSPHLKEFTERIKLNGAEISERFVIDFVGRITRTIEKVHPSFFEATVAMAFDYFARERVDVAVIEVGLGGRLDSTNVITPIVSLITNISNDHKDLLGDTLQKIAGEKAGIIKSHIPVVISQQQPDVEAVFLDKALAESAPLFFASSIYQVRAKEEPGLFDVFKDEVLYFTNLRCELKGAYQQKNIAGVLAVVDQLRANGFIISTEHVREGITNVVKLTGLKGRWQTIRSSPLTICDIGHNEDGITEVLKNINLISYDKLHIVFGMVNDKDISGVLALLPKKAIYYFCQAKIPRAMDAEMLASKARDSGLEGKVIPDVNEAILEATASAGSDDLIFIGGSTFVVAEIISL